MNRIDGVSFGKAWPRRIRTRIKTGSGLVPIFYVDLSSLLKNKRATGRPKDMDDARFLGAKSLQKQSRRRASRA